MKMTTWHRATGSDCSRKSTTAPEPSAHAMTLTRTLPRSFHSRNSVFCLWSNLSGTARTREGFFVDLASLFFSLPHVWRPYAASLAFLVLMRVKAAVVFDGVQHQVRDDNFKETVCSAPFEIINTVWETNQRQHVIYYTSGKEIHDERVQNTPCDTSSVNLCLCIPTSQNRTDQCRPHSSQKVSSCSILKPLSDLPSYGGVDNSVRIAVENRESSVRT